MTKILIPILSKEEENQEFLDEATQKVDVIFLLLVMDTDVSLSRLGYTTKEMWSASKKLEHVKSAIGKKRKTVNEFTVWGPTIEKIINSAIIHQVDRVVLKRSDEKEFKKLEDSLRKGLKKEKITVHVI